MSVKIIPKYIRSRFLGIFGFCLFSVVMVFLVVDLVESLDRFIDRNVPAKIILLYYLNYVPYILVLGVPVTTLLASVFSMGTLAKNNEMVALKSLGYSLYKVMGTFLIMGLIISAVTFVLSEGVVSRTNRNKEDIRRKYLEGDIQRVSSDSRNLEIQEPPDQIVTMAYFDPGKKIARRVKIETYHENHLTGRVDTDSMMWLDGSWIVLNGYKRTFEEDHETAIPISR